jgi:glycosyltransferase involved in cell wall biosynthesis
MSARHIRMLSAIMLGLFGFGIHADENTQPVQEYTPYQQDQKLVDSVAMIGEERHIVIITCSYNNAEFYKWNLDSIFGQNYENYHLIYVDDCSSDGTTKLVQEYIKENNVEDKVVFIHNEERRKALANLYYAIHTCKATDIVIIVDGDDRFAHENVLRKINEVYADGNTWLTYGQFREYPSGVGGFCHMYPAHIVRRNGFRYYPGTPSHLRTFYAGLFQKIRLEDLKFQGEFFPMTYDLAMMFPMIEMARSHFKFIPEVLLEYNAVNPISDHKVSKKLQRKCDLIIRARTCYSEVGSPF